MVLVYTRRVDLGDSFASRSAMKSESVFSKIFGEIGTKGVAFVVDVSGSMGGSPIEAVKQDLVDMLSKLPRGSSFNIWKYNSSWSCYNDADWCVAPDAGAISWVNGLSAGGGTTASPPVLNALARSGVKEVRLLCDGDIGDLQSAVSGSNPYGVPIHTVSVNDGSKDGLQAVATATGGTFRSKQL